MNKELFIKASSAEVYENNKASLDPNSITFIEKESEQSILIHEVKYRGVPQERKLGQILRSNNGKLVFTENNIFTTNNVGDVVLYDTVSKLLFCCSDITLLPNLTQYIPIGIVVIPSSHNVYGTGEAGIMSLTIMSATNPTIGLTTNTNSQKPYFGSSVDIPGIPYFTGVVIHGDKEVGFSNQLLGTALSARIPNDTNYSGNTPYPLNPDLSYDYRNSFAFGPSPFNLDGSRNTNYYSTKYGTLSNCLSDFNGRYNTKKILEVRGSKDYSTWKPGATVRTDFPAASCCDMFCPAGTKQGDWYLPAVGESGYIISNILKIETLKRSLKELFPSVPIVGFDIGSAQITSSMPTKSKHWHIHMNGFNSGQVERDVYTLETPAFMRGLFPRII